MSDLVGNPEDRCSHGAAQGEGNDLYYQGQHEAGQYELATRIILKHDFKTLIVLAHLSR